MVVSLTSSYSSLSTTEMNANNTYRQRSNTTGDLPSVFGDDDPDGYPAVCPDWGCGGMGNEHQRIFSRSWSSSTGSTGSWTDDSLSSEDKIEDRHFAKALDQGVLDSVHEKNRKDRRKSFEKDHHHHHHHKSSKKHLHLHTTSDDNNNHHHLQHHHHHHHHNRPRSKSIDVRVSSPSAGDKTNDKYLYDNTSTSKHGSSGNRRMSKRKLRQELCNSGINLNDAATEERSIDEIYEMQNRFFTSLKLTSDYIRQCSSDECGGAGYMDMPSSPVRKNRSVSFHWLDSSGWLIEWLIYGSMIDWTIYWFFKINRSMELMNH